LANPGLAWYDDRRTELVRGADLDIRNAPGRARIVRVVAANAGAGKAELEVTLGTPRDRLEDRYPDIKQGG
jgi:hypothetical protein